MKNKGFTLIELLAVIVILAIIALIATPIIIGIINDSKKQSTIRSAELYESAVKNATLAYNLRENKKFPYTSCDILDGGNLSCNGVTVPVDINNPSQIKGGGTITFANGEITQISGLIVSGKTFNKANKDSTLVMAESLQETLESTDASCFVTANERVTSFDVNYNVCLAATPQLFSNMGSYLSSEDADSLCNKESIWGGLYLEDFLDNPTYLSMFENNEIIYNVETETISGVYIKDYTCSDKNVVIPSTINSKSVLGIATGAFMNKELTGITLPNTITFIGTAAFTNNQLTSLIVPNGVQKIYYGAFSVNNINNLTLGNSLVIIGPSAFSSNQIESLTIPNTVTTIGTYAFYRNRITELALGNSIEMIGEGAFYANYLTSLTIPNSVTTIGNHVFQYNQLESLTIPNSVTTIGESAFAGNNIETVTIGSGITSIGNSAFSSLICKVINNSNACSSSVENIPEEYQSGETYGPNALTSVTINKCENDVTVGNSAFGWASGYNAENNLHWKTTGCE